MKRSLLLAAAVPLIVLPGLMSGSAAAAVPTAAGASVFPATDPAPPGDIAKTLDDFVACLKDHGVDVPQPGPGKPLLVEAGPGDGAKRDAIEACVPDLPPPSGAPGRAGNPDELKQFAQCMRDHGLPDFPDPTEKGLVVQRDEVGPGTHPGDPTFDSAQEACKDELPAPMAGDAKGPFPVGEHGVGGPGIGVAVAVGGAPAGAAGVEVHIGKAG
jgi:hypothetical protein